MGALAPAPPALLPLLLVAKPAGLQYTAEVHSLCSLHRALQLPLLRPRSLHAPPQCCSCIWLLHVQASVPWQLFVQQRRSSHSWHELSLHAASLRLTGLPERAGASMQLPECRYWHQSSIAHVKDKWILPPRQLRACAFIRIIGGAEVRCRLQRRLRPSPRPQRRCGAIAPNYDSHWVRSRQSPNN